MKLTREQRVERAAKNRELGGWFRDRRQKLGMSLKSLSQLVGYTVSTLSQLETGNLESVSDRLTETVDRALEDSEVGMHGN